MQLKLEQLQRVVKKTIREEKVHSTLREEFFRVFGAPVMVSNDLERVAEAVNDQIDILEATGRDVPRTSIRTSVLLEASTSRSTEVRKVAARLLPERFAAKFLGDRTSAVRCAAARRMPLKLVKECFKHNPDDDALRSILRSKKLTEAGVPTPKPVDEPFDLHGDGPLGDVVKQPPGDDLSDFWYMTLAKKICMQYGTNVEGQWEEAIATRTVASHYSTTGVMLDREKLLNAIYDCIEEREAAVVKEGSLKSIAARLLRESHMDDAVIPVLDETLDPIDELLANSHSSRLYVESAEKFFAVRKSTVPAGVKKYRLGEGTWRETSVPVNGTVPGGRITPKVEKALDNYVAHWNDIQARSGEPYKISWGMHPSGIDMIGFNLELK